MAKAKLSERPKLPAAERQRYKGRKADRARQAQATFKAKRDLMDASDREKTKALRAANRRTLRTDKLREFARNLSEQGKHTGFAMIVDVRPGGVSYIWRSFWSMIRTKNFATEAVKRRQWLRIRGKVVCVKSGQFIFISPPPTPDPGPSQKAIEREERRARRRGRPDRAFDADSRQRMAEIVAALQSCDMDFVPDDF